ncbi:hypothetical protein ES705_17744 [subsurface metagenome]
MINIFCSRPTWVAEEFKEGLTGFLAFLGTHGLKPRTIGSTDYPTESPLIEVIRLMDECEGAIILGYPQIYVIKSNIKGLEKNDFPIPTEWNHIEATLAFSKNLPLLVIHHKGISGGIFDHGAISKFIYEKDLSKNTWFLSDNISGALMKWKASITQRQKETTSAPLTISKPPPSIPTQLKQERLDDSVESVLLYLFKTSARARRTLEIICRELHCVNEAAKYCIEKLRKEELISWEFYSPNDYDVVYTVTSKGRTYVMSNKLISI